MIRIFMRDLPGWDSPDLHAICTEAEDEHETDLDDLDAIVVIDAADAEWKGNMDRLGWYLRDEYNPPPAYPDMHETIHVTRVVLKDGRQAWFCNHC